MRELANIECMRKATEYRELEVIEMFYRALVAKEVSSMKGGWGAGPNPVPRLTLAKRGELARFFCILFCFGWIARPARFVLSRVSDPAKLSSLAAAMIGKCRQSRGEHRWNMGPEPQAPRPPQARRLPRFTKLIGPSRRDLACRSRPK